MVLLSVFSLAMLFAVAFGSPFSYFYVYSLAAYSVVENLDRKICPENNTNVERYREIVGDARKCYTDSFQGNHSICRSLEMNVQICSQPLVDYFVECLPEKSKDLPPAIAQASASIVDALCTSTGEILLEAVNGCLYDISMKANKTIKEECKKDTLKPKLDKFDKELPSKSEACQVGREIGDCWEEHVNHECKNSKTKELFSKFYNAVLSPCTDNEIL